MTDKKQTPPTLPYGLLFDLDGTLAETAPDLCTAVNYILQQNNLPPTPMEDLRNMIGEGARGMLQSGINYHGATWDNARLDMETENLVAYYHDHIAEETILHDGVLAILDKAKAENIKLAIVTNKRHGLADQLLQKLNVRDYFPVLLGGDDLPTRKPEPEMLEEAARQLGCAIENCIMLGDSEADTKAAKAAGMKSICVSFGYRRVPLDQLGADALIDHYNQLPAALAKLDPAFSVLADSFKA